MKNAASGRIAASRLPLLLGGLAVLVCITILMVGRLAVQPASAGPGTGLGQPAAAATPPPLPTPTPDPMALPAWARGRVLHKVPVRKTDKVYALTFDDGPWPGSTGQILRILDQYQVKATFFMVGQELHNRPKVGQAVLAAGHAVGNHSWDHPSRPRDPVGQVRRTDAEIHRDLGITPNLFRPPYGILKNGMARQALAEHDAVLIWSADSNDWGRPGARAIASRIINQASPGGIALMHDGGGDRSQTVAALPTIITSLRARGYRFVTIPELLRLYYVAPQPAKAAKKPKLVHPPKKAPSPVRATPALP